MLRPGLSAIQLEHLHSVDFSAINMKAKSGPDCVPALVSAGSGVDIQEVLRLIIHYFQDVGMTADEKVRTVLPDEVPGFGIIVPRRSADMGHQHPEPFAVPETEHRTPVQQAPVVAIADDALQRFERRNLRLQVQSAPEVPGVPDLVDILQECLEFGAERPVRIRYESDVQEKPFTFSESAFGGASGQKGYFVPPWG